MIVGDGNPKYDVAVQRLQPDGSVASSVGINLRGAFVEGFDEGRAVALQPDGKILVAGATQPAGGEQVLAVLRVNADLSLDKSFAPGGPDGDGIRLIDYSGGDDEAMALALQPDGRIVVVGRSTLLNANGWDVVIQRLMSDGSPDASFGPGGLVDVNLGGNDSGFAVALQRDGKILVAGSTTMSGDSDFAPTATTTSTAAPAKTASAAGRARTASPVGGDATAASAARAATAPTAKSSAESRRQNEETCPHTVVAGARHSVAGAVHLARRRVIRTHDRLDR